VKVDNQQAYKLIFSISEHPYLGVLIHPYVVALSIHQTLTLTYQKVFSGNAAHYDRLTSEDLKLIASLDDLMEESVVRRFSPEKKIRPKEYFNKHHTPLLQTEIIRPSIEKRIANFIAILPLDTDNLYVADDINPAAFHVGINQEFTKILFHFHKTELGTNYFVTLKHKDERIPFMKIGGLMLTKNPARMVVNGQLYRFYDFVDGAKLAVFLNKKLVFIPKTSEKKYYTNFIKPLLETSPVFTKGFEIITIKEEATPNLSLTIKNGNYGFNVMINYGSLSFPFHQDKLFHVKLEWNGDQPIFTKYKRSQIWEANRINALSELGLSLVSGSFFSLPDTDLQSCIEWLRHHNDVLAASHFQVITTMAEKYSISSYQLHYNIADKIDWFDLNAQITIGEYTIPFSQVVHEMRQGNNRIILPNQEVFLFPKEWFALGEALAGHSNKDNTYSIKKYQVDILGLIQSKEIKQHLTKLVAIQAEKPHPNFVGTLRNYQLDGLSWLMFLKNNNFGGVLADDMGLGKTVQTISFLQRVKYDIFQCTEKKAKFLLIAPTSLLYNWVYECSQFSPDLSTLIHSGAKRTKSPVELEKYDLVITTYGLIRNDESLFTELQYDVIVLDESQNIKNHNAKTTQSIAKLNAACQVALTGTPIENSIRDLWSQMNVLNKGLLGSLKQFETRYAKPIEKEGDDLKAEELRKIIKPFLLRRTKEEVAKELPPLTEKIIYCDMTEEQAEYYETIKSEYRNNILDLVDVKGFEKSKFSILQGLSKLRQLANHPSLIDEQYTAKSGKHEALLHKIATAISDGHKLLVFSQFVRYLEIIEKDLQRLGLSYYKLTGATSKENRAKRVKEFQAQLNPAVFLISLKAGGTGLNLTSADYVFIVDPWWNPASEAQARDRTHRIGQKNSVFSYKFISRDTIEEKISLLQRKKQGFSKNIIVSENNVLANLDMNEIQYLLS
jgi:superfamily II DNA or RNA helicase